MNRIARFYKEVTVTPADGGFTVLLDTKPVQTPARAPLVAPNRALADAIANEWRAQATKVDPAIMPLTRMANTAIDRITEARDAVITELVGFGKADLICYRADTPADLAARQAEIWDPLLDWAQKHYGADMRATRGLRYVAQPDEAVVALQTAVARFDAFGLSALHTAVTILGSLVIALALAEGRLDPTAAYAAAHLDEAHQTERWGQDALALARTHGRETELAAAALVLQSLRESRES